ESGPLRELLRRQQRRVLDVFRDPRPRRSEVLERECELSLRLTRTSLSASLRHACQLPFRNAFAVPALVQKVSRRRSHTDRLRCQQSLAPREPERSDETRDAVEPASGRAAARCPKGRSWSK